MDDDKRIKVIDNDEELLKDKELEQSVNLIPFGEIYNIEEHKKRKNYLYLSYLKK